MSMERLPLRMDRSIYQANTVGESRHIDRHRRMPCSMWSSTYLEADARRAR